MVREIIPQFVTRAEKKIGEILTRFQEGLMLDGEAQSITGAKTFDQLASKVADTLAPTGATQEIDWENGNIQVLDLNDTAAGDVTLTMVNPVAGAKYILKIIQGAQTDDVVLPANVLFAGGTAPATINVSIADDAIDTIEMVYDGTNYLATLVQAYG